LFNSLISKDLKYYLIYKPYGVLSSFTSEVLGKKTLSTFVNLDKDIYPVGRLDEDSEGLLILTNDNYLKNRLLDPKFGHLKTYYVQVEGEIDYNSISNLKNGVEIKIKDKIYFTKKSNVIKLDKIEHLLPERNTPIRYRAKIPTSWISIELTEGKNRQVRKMTAKVGFPTLRLVRVSINKLSIFDFEFNNTPIQIPKKTAYSLLLKL